jgi:hypothetical protein
MLPTRRVTFTCSTHLKLLSDEMKEVEYFAITNFRHDDDDDINERMMEPSSTHAPATVSVQVALHDVHDRSGWWTSFLFRLRCAKRFLPSEFHWDKQ